MGTIMNPNWQADNQRYLMAELQRIGWALQQHVQSNSSQLPQYLPEPSPERPCHTPPFALEQLCQTFGLSEFEQDILLLCAGTELDTTLRGLCAQAQPDLKHGSPTFSLAGLILNQCHWTAFTPHAPLRRWQMVEMGASTTAMTAPLRIDERILHYLMGISQVDQRLTSLLKPLYPSDFLVASHQQCIEEIKTTWSQSAAFGKRPILQLCGAGNTNKQSIAAFACDQLGRSLYALSSHAIPLNSPDLHQLIQLWEREAALSPVALLLELDEMHEPEAARHSAIAFLIESVTSPVIVSSRDRRSFNHPVVTLEVENPTTHEQLQLWQHALGDGTDSNSIAETLVAQFNLSPVAIQTASLRALSHQNDWLKTAQMDSVLQTRLWEICRTQARPQLDELAQRIDPGEQWDDLVLPELQKQILREITAQVQQRSKVYEQWGFAQKGRRGLGISALFSGLSGTGKTMAAGILSQELRLDLYRIDLSSVVSKYIGETEKNLRRVFDAAEAGGVILLFDEADALFGKRSEVKDSHDRYANMEVSYLLQRMEAYRGLAILTTNLKDAIDPAFMRRIRFIVKFPFPEYGDRIQIWQRIFPAETPIQSLNYKKLARLNIAGGNIRNIAMNAAFLAAHENQPVRMVHLLKASQNEYLKLERTMTEAEMKGWIEEE